MRCRSLLFLLATLATVAPAPAASQSQSSAIPTIDLGTRLKIRAPGVLIEDGVLSDMIGDTLLVSEMDQEWAVPIENLQSLQVDRNRSLVGGVAGAFLGAGFGFLANKALSGEEVCGTPPNQPLHRYCETVYSPSGPGVIGGAAIGMAVGWFAGRSMHYWDEVFR